jgi:DNA-binding XRE family transcriptional regulator
VRHRHLEYSPGPPEEWPLAALVDVLQRGDLADWRPIAMAVARDPHGPLAARVLDLLAAYPAYGTSALWRAWIERRRAAAETALPAVPAGLAGLRRRMGLTQVEVARRIGISQSDLSKLERREDMRLSTLVAYTEAMGGRLRLLYAGSAEIAEIRVGAGAKTGRRTRRARRRKPRRP